MNTTSLEPLRIVEGIPRRSGVRWRILALVCAASFVALFLRTNMAIAQKGIQTDLKLSFVQIGLVQAAFAWTYAIFQIPGGILGTVLGARRIVAYMILAWGLLTLLTGLVPGGSLAPPLVSLASLMMLRGLLGMSQAPTFPVTCPVVFRWFPVSGWALPNGLIGVALTLGGAAAGPMIAWLMETSGWRLSFLLASPLAFLLAAIWWRSFRDTPEEHVDVSAAELELIHRDRPEPRHATIEKQRGEWKGLFRNRDMLLLTISYFSMSFVFCFFQDWMPRYLTDERGFKILASGVYSAGPWIGAAVGQLAGGLVCDGLSKRFGLTTSCRIAAITGLVLTAGFMSLAASVRNGLLAVLLFSVCNACSNFAEIIYWPAIIRVSRKNAAPAGGMVNTAGNLATAIGALLLPITVQRFGWTAALASVAILSLAGAVIWFGIRPDRLSHDST